jgi:hypothetical protein
MYKRRRFEGLPSLWEEPSLTDLSLQASEGGERRSVIREHSEPLAFPMEQPASGKTTTS